MAGNAQAQKALGDLYAAGTGVEQDMAEAIRWYEIAAGIRKLEPAAPTTN